MRIALILIALISAAGLYGQAEEIGRSDYKSWDVQLAYGVQQPIGVLSKRFGYNLNIGGGLRHRWSGQRYFAGVEGAYLFGRDVKESTVDWLYNEDGYIFGWSSEGGFEVPLYLRERGYYAGVQGGRLFSVGGEERLNFVRVNLGIGFLQHKIHFVDNSRALAQLIGDYGKGLDRLTYGWALRQGIAYEHVSAKNRFNYYLSLEMTEGFTRNRRSFNYDTGMRDTAPRLDVLLALKFGYFFSYYYGASDTLIYY